ncbi:hypothetical protein ACIA47_15540 [Micromonospora sp. NPDC051227]|uniref:hypothetical protein n=1 Tax=Micromonospora sp. NPDC051227 TaxID=3364285 RepID=UPI0037B1A974
MAAADRFTGPLASAWPDVGVARLEWLLTSPELTLPVPPAHHRGVWAEPHVHGPTLADLRATAERDRTTPWPTPLANQYARYHRYGDRETYERQVFARQRRLTRASLIAAVTLDNGWLDEIVDGVTLLCEHSSWCWPAHDDARTVHGTVLPTVTDPYLDLGAGEVAAQLAWIDHLLGEPLDVRAPGLRASVRYEVDRRGLTPFTTRRDWHWLGLDGDVRNWNPWIHGNVLVAALRLVDDQTRRAQTFGPDRYGIWTMQSAWHNVPHPRATGQSPGRGSTARHVTHVADDIRSAATMDIAPAYPRSDLRHWWRAARFERRGGHVEIVDTWAIDPAVEPPPTHVHLLVAGAGRIRLSWRPASALCAATVRPIEDPMLLDVWGARLHRLAIDVTAFGPSGELVLTVEELPPHEALHGGAP